MLNYSNMRKKTSSKPAPDDMRPEYDFTGGVRGKHHKALQEGYILRIYKPDGTVVEKRVGTRKQVTKRCARRKGIVKHLPKRRRINS